MKKLVVYFYLSFMLIASIEAQEIVQIKQPQLPILIDRQDNILFYLRVDTDIENSKVFNNVTLNFDKDVNLNEIKAIKLYYSGIENVQRKGQEYFSPVQYISRDTPGKTLAANTSYSIKKSETNHIKNKITLSADQNMMNGINYFWISIEMNPKTSIHSQIKTQIEAVSIDGKSASIKSDKDITRHLGIGVRHAGDDGAAAYRIPGMVTSNKGTLLSVYDVRYNNSADLQEYVDIGLSRSSDGGQTWEPMRIPIKFGEYGGLPKAQNGVGDPAILVDKTTRTIWIVAAWTHGMGNGRAWTNSQQGMSIDKTAQLVLAKSDDDGKTWSQPINITEQLKQPEWYFLLQGPGNGITMADGTIVFANQFIGADRIPNAGIMYSKDHGKTWNTHNYARSNTTEAQVVEVSKGVLMLNMRDNRGGSRAVYTTTDLGKTWHEHESSRSALQEPICMASLIKIAAKENVFGKDILLFSNPNTTKERKNITIKASMDGGLTWLPENQLLIDDEHGWGYSCLSQVDKETVGILYEASVAHMTYQAFKLTDIIKKP